MLVSSLGDISKQLCVRGAVTICCHDERKTNTINADGRQFSVALYFDKLACACLSHRKWSMQLKSVRSRPQTEWFVNGCNEGGSSEPELTDFTVIDLRPPSCVSGSAQVHFVAVVCGGGTLS